MKPRAAASSITSTARSARSATNYGKVDVLWYDVNWPLTPEGWESEKMNKMVREPPARHFDQQPLRNSRRLHNSRTAYSGLANTLGSVHDDER